MKELLKWLQGVGVAVAYSIAGAVSTSVPSAEVGTLAWLVQSAVVALLVRLVGWAVGKLPQTLVE